ncbi:SMEK domain-containing protein [Coleofasciculus chthonoplastes]|uniref:SMEK domain-containing protein n=1 Tax=Coleofasciculus chthonoplastes TaxID=64178 RepID=UPI0032FD5A6D
MSSFVTQVKGATAMTRTDINKVAETLLIPLFSEVYGYTDLQNMNDTEGSNYPGIDLGDERARVAFQITSTSNSEKIKKTLRKFVEYKLYEKYDRLIIYILTEKQQSYSGSGYDEIIQNKFTFDKDKDIWDYRDILKAVANLQVNQVRRIEAILEENFGEERRLTEWEVVDKVEQTISEYTQLFVGREEERQKLARFLQENSSGLFLVTAPAGFGKTALLANWVKELQNKDCDIAYHFFNERTRSIETAYRNLIRQLDADNEFAYDLSSNNKDNLRTILYNGLRSGRQTEKPLIIVIDGLDEAGEIFLPPFPNPLPENVFVIASARAEKGQEQKYLEGWTEKGEPLHLERLSKSAIAQWLREAGNGELAGFADDTSLVNQLDQITQGFPLYLSCLIDDLCHHAPKHIQNIQELLAQTPKSFEEYVQQQIKRLDELDLPDERWQFFALLAVAKGALTKEDIKAVTKMRDRQLRQMHLCWQVTRWIRITADNLYAFAHPLLATTFAAKLDDDEDAEDALENLIDYCSHWQEHQSHYALQYYPEHLREEKRWEELYAIARNPDFAATQSEQLPNEPDLPLKTVQAALLGAVEEDKAERMAEFVLIHAHRLGQTNAQESPLEALRSDSLKRAWVLADQYEIERCILWYLLLAWELKDEGKLDDARDTLKRLQQKNLPFFPINGATDWQHKYAAYFLAHIFEVSEETCLTLHQRLFEYSAPGLLCIFLTELGKVQAALKIVEWIILELKKPFPFPEILKAQAEKGNSQEAQIVFAKALEITRQTFPNCWWVWGMGDIAKAQIKLGQREDARATFSEALEATHKIENQKHRMRTLIDIANYQADAGLFSDVRETLQRIEFQGDLEDYWIELAKAQAKIGDREQARISFSRAKQFAQNIQDKGKSYYFLGRIARKQAEIGELADALKTTEELANLNPKSIERLLSSIANQKECDDIIFIYVLETANRIYDNSPDYYKDMILQEIVAVQAQKAQRRQEYFTDAITTARQIKNKRRKAESLLTIVKGQTKLRWFDQAIETANMIDMPDNQTDKDEALIEIIKGQVTAGKFDDAFTLERHIQSQIKQKDALVEIATAYAHAKNFSHAIQIANGLFNTLTKLELLKSIATIQYQIGLAKEARDTFALGLKYSLDYDVSYQSASTLLNMAELLLLSAQNEKGLAYAKDAHEIAKNIKKLSQKVNILARLGEVYAKLGKRNQVKGIFTEAIDIVQKIEKQNSPNHTDWHIVELFKTIGIAQAKAGEFDAALETVEKIKLIGHKALVLQTLAQVHPEAEQRERLKTALTTIHENALSSWNGGFDHAVTTLSSIAVAWQELGERQAALDIWAEACEIIEEEKAKRIKTNPDSLLSTVAGSQVKVGEITLAWENTNKIEDGWTQAKTLSDIASFQWNQGAQDGLSGTLNAVFKAKEKITDEQKRLKALWRIAQIQVMAGQVEQAFNTAEKVLINRNQLLCHIAVILVQLKDKNNFKRLLVPCAYNLETAYQMCGLIARLYPEQAESVAKVVADLN